MKMNKKLKKGFTLVELVVVIAVIAILAGVSVGAYFGITESAKNSKADQEAKAFHTTVMLVVNDPDSGISYNKTTGLSTTNASDLEAKIEHMSGQEFFIASVSESGTAYTYTSEANKKASGYFGVKDKNTVFYISTDNEVRNIDIATGAISEPTGTYTVSVATEDND